MKNFVALVIITLAFSFNLLAQTATRKSNARPSSAPAPAKPKGEKFDAATPAEMARHCVLLKTESGEIAVELFPEAAPEAVRNFLNLTSLKAFDGTTFHRVVKDFVVQGGDLFTRPAITNELAARAARRLPDEPNYIKHTRGILSMARGDEANTATTSFFIVMSDSPHLDNKFAAFGRVVRGIEAVDKINAAPLDGEKPKNPVRVLQATTYACEAANTETKTSPR